MQRSHHTIVHRWPASIPNCHLPDLLVDMVPGFYSYRWLEEFINLTQPWHKISSFLPLIFVNAADYYQSNFSMLIDGYCQLMLAGVAVLQ